jgi:Tfp pilus assembly protein PilF
MSIRSLSRQTPSRQNARPHNLDLLSLLPVIEESIPNQPRSCPSCGASVGNENVCPNCGTVISRADAGIEANELKSVDQQLLERFEKEPSTPTKPVPYQVTIGILLGVVLLAMALFLITQKEEKYAEGRPEAAHGEHHEGDGHDHGVTSAQDSIQMLEQMAILNGRIDSIEHHLESHPADDSARINLATALSIKGDYPKAKTIYEAHLAKHPNDADVRVDYASVVIETTNDPKAGMAELEKAIKIDPQNAKALFNAGILALQLQEDHNAGFAKSREYLKRAKVASIKDNPQFAGQIDMLLHEMDKKEADIKIKKDSIEKASGKKY